MTLKILIVEDEGIIACDIEATLKRLGYSIPAIVSSGEEVLQIVAMARPDLVLMDIKLRGRMDGIETAHRLRENFKIPIIYLTAHADEEMLKRAKFSEPFGYIVKPFEEKSLHTAIEMAVYKSQMDQREEWRRLQLQKLTETALSLRLNSQLSIGGVLQAITEKAREIIGAHQAMTAVILDQNWAEALNVSSFSDKYAAWKTFKEKTDFSGMYELVCRENRPVCMTHEELESHPELHNLIKGMGKTRPPMRSWLAAPLRGRDHRNMGLIHLTDKYQGEFSVEDGAMLMQLAHFASSVIENVQLYRDAEESKRQLKRKTQELSSSNEELERFASVASHDLQEPLRMISMYLELLVSQYKEKLDSNANKYIRYAQEGANRSANLIRELLNYSIIGRQESFKPTDTGSLITRVLSILKLPIMESGAEITQDILPTLVVDSFQMVQLFQNLLANALKYRSPERPLKIHISAQLKENEEEWVFSIRDNGIGIDPQYKDRIFAIFQRLHAKEESDGAGIGLAVCKKVVERHHGRIWVESKQNEGAVFCFTLPDRGKEISKSIKDPRLSQQK